MSKSRRTDAQMIAALKQVEAGRTTEDVAREQGVSKHNHLCLEGEIRGHGSKRGRRGQATCATKTPD